MPLQPFRLLHLEDSDLDADLIRERLEKTDLPLIIERVIDRTSFIKQLQEQTYAIVVSDFKVPTFDGMEALQLARSIRPGIPFIFCSGQIGEEFAVETLRCGATDYILKERLARLPSAVERAVTEWEIHQKHLAIEMESREIERRLRFAHEAARLGVWELNLETEEFVCSEICKQNLGLAPDADNLTFQSHLSLVHPLDRDRVQAAIRTSAATGTDYDIEYRVVFPDESIHWLNVRGRMMPSDHGRAPRMNGASLDVTARKRAEQAVEESEAKFRGLANTIPNLAWMADSEGNFFWYNDRWYEYTGTNPSDVEGWGWQSLHDPEVLPHVVKNWQQSLTGGEPFEMVFPLRGADGVFRSFLTRSESHRGVDGKVLHWIGTNTDISAQKQAEAQLLELARHERRRAEIFDRLAASSRSLNSVLSQESIVTILSEEARQILEADTSAVAIGSDPPVVSQRRTQPSAQHSNSVADRSISRVEPRDNHTASSIEAVSADSKSYTLDVPLVGHSGKELGTLTVTRETANSFTKEDEAVLAQIAAIASVSIENARLYQALREQDKRKDEFLATLSHELRNPLAPLRNGMAILRISGAGNQVATLEMMDRQLNQMVRLVDDLLDVSRVTSGKFKLQRQRVDLKSLMKSAIETSKPLIASGKHELAITLPTESVILNVDPTRIAQVITNLLNNAAKYTPTGGRIGITAEKVGNHVSILVTDSGIGIPEQMLSKIFDVFTQVGSARDRSQGGLGIGLTIVRRLVEMHQGTVLAESDGPGSGSRFTVQLPLATASDIALDDGESHLDGRLDKLPSQRILIVDDNIDGAESVAQILKFAGHDVLTAHDGFRALDAVEQFKPRIVLLDIGLPGMNGYDVARKLRANPHHQSIVLVAVTGWGSDEDRRHSKNAGFDFHLTKPVALAALGDIIKNLPEPSE